MVTAGHEEFGLPLTNVDAIVRITHEEARTLDADPAATDSHAGVDYPVAYLGTALSIAEPIYHNERYPLIMMRSGENRIGLRVDELRERNEVVVKSVGPMLGSIRWISGAAIMGDGGWFWCLTRRRSRALQQRKNPPHWPHKTLNSSRRRRLTEHPR
ncbi:MAG: hypothetical protein HOI95_06040 [Chromatiales bacterium]|jgi:chemosensory pili system protein ChpA (sensor histidine kinase/response regulator)|nr:hypothetical protein [Chromatiales bacterium]